MLRFERPIHRERSTPMLTATKPEGAVAIPKVPNLVAGKWTTSSASRSGDVFNPSTGVPIASVPLSSAAEVNSAVEAAAAALPAWAETPVVERARLMFRFRELLLRDFDAVAVCVTRE